MKRFYGLDMLRGIAAIIVAFNHAVYQAHAFSAFSRSYLAVDFFFLLSGFVISAAFEDRMPEMGVWKFLDLRFSRLWPPIALGILVAAAVRLTSGGNHYVLLLQTCLALAFLPTITGTFYLNGPMWSIHFELFANALHTLFLRRLPTTILLILAMAGVAVILSSQGFRDMDLGQGDRYLLGFPRVIISYCMGIAIWRLNGSREHGAAWMAFLLLPVALLGSSQVTWADYAIILLVNPVILLLGIRAPSGERTIAVARFIGSWSFPLYALHWPIEEFALSIGCSWGSAFIWSLIVSFIIGAMVDRRMRDAIPLYRIKATWRKIIA